MVKFGKIIIRSQRVGWESAYLNYKELKKIVASIEDKLFLDKHALPPVAGGRGGGLREEEGALLLAQSVSVAEEIVKDDLATLKRNFFTALRLEIEKISLFILQQQGKIADAVGALRFYKDENLKHLFDQFSPLFGSSNNNNNNNKTTDEDDDDNDDDKLNLFTILCVELLHLVRFICINSVGIRKILKKYNKAFERMDAPHYYVVAGDHLHQMGSFKSTRAILSSLQIALTERFYHHYDTADLPFFRFQCALECNYALGRRAKILQDSVLDVLSRRALILTGKDLNGMDVGSQRAFQWLLRLEPELILRMNRTELELLWNRVLGNSLASSPALSERPDDDTKLIGAAAAVSPTSPLRGRSFHDSLDDTVHHPQVPKRPFWGGVNRPSMTLNLLSTLLYTVNYYVVAPTANHYARMLGLDGAFGATIIGASSFSALFAAFFYSFWYTKGTFKSSLVFSSLMAVIGNLIYALALSYESMSMAILGRIFCGFGSAEVVNRQLISACVDFEGMTQASALFVAASAIGMSLGPLLAGILDVWAGRDGDVDLPFPTPVGGLIFNNVTSPGFVMACLWFAQMVALLLSFEEPDRINSSEDYDLSEMDRFFDSESMQLEVSVLPDNPELSRSTSETTGYGSVTRDPLNMTFKEWGARFPLFHELAVTLHLIFQNPALPITILVFGYIELTDEVLISSCSMVIGRYFSFPGSMAGFFIASLGTLVLPSHFVVEKATHYMSERKILLRTLVVIFFCLCGIFNWTAMAYDVVGDVELGLSNVTYNTSNVADTELDGKKLGDILTTSGEFPYDEELPYNAGPVMYMFFLSMIFMGTIVLEGVDTSIMAKVTPANLNARFLNCGLLATLTGTLGRVVADSMITMSALLDNYIFVDFVNATFFPLAILTLGGIYLVLMFYERLL